MILSETTGDLEPLSELLADIKQVFDAEEVDAMLSVVLVQKLKDLEASPWKEQRLTVYKLAKMLGPAHIGPKQLWTDPGIGRKTSRQGYERAQFEEAFSRLL